MMILVNFLLGLALLASGRKLFWLFVAAAGFMTGLQIAFLAVIALIELCVLIGAAVFIVSQSQP